jgi:hypothetical protein
VVDVLVEVDVLVLVEVLVEVDVLVLVLVDVFVVDVVVVGGGFTVAAKSLAIESAQKRPTRVVEFPRLMFPVGASMLPVNFALRPNDTSFALALALSPRTKNWTSLPAALNTVCSPNEMSPNTQIVCTFDATVITVCLPMATLQ